MNLAGSNKNNNNMAPGRKGSTRRGAHKQVPAKGKPLTKTNISIAAAAAATMAGDEAAPPTLRRLRRSGATGGGELDLIAKLNTANVVNTKMRAELPAIGMTDATGRGKAARAKTIAMAGVSTAAASGAKLATSKDTKGKANAPEQEGGGDRDA